MQLGDVQHTYSDDSSLTEWIGPTNYTYMKKGIKNFIKWYKVFYKY